VQAGCLRNADPVIRQLQGLVSENAAKALRETQTRLDALEHAPRSDPELNAALYAVQAQSYSALELDGDARNAALRGLRLAPNAKDPTHLDLLSAYAENVYDEAGINSAVEEIETARALQTAGSPADTCLLITLGRLQYRQDRGDLAILSLTKAYRASLPPEFAEQRVRAAAALSSVMRGMGDYTQAMALNQEVIDWDTSHGASLDLPVSRFLRGSIHMTMRDYPAATDQFTQARKLSVELGDQQGIAFADLSLCEAQIELGQLIPAEQQCRSALRVFTAAQSTDVVKEARAALAN
jgi:tetratricopeptide (TPR) repeat protein